MCSIYYPFSVHSLAVKLWVSVFSCGHMKETDFSFKIKESEIKKNPSVFTKYMCTFSTFLEVSTTGS